MNTGTHEYDELTHQLAAAGRAVADLTGALPIAFPDGKNPNGGGAGANYFDPRRVIATLMWFTAEVNKELHGIARWRMEHPGPDDKQN